jgi:hypothetical protein
MKKLYFLDEEEKNRILNLHESLKPKSVIKEDAGEVAGYAAAGAAAGVAFMGVGAIPGALIGGTVGLVMGLLRNSNSSDGAKRILQACTNKKEVGPATQTRQQLNAIADAINTAIEGVGTDEKAIKTNLQKITTIPDLCAMAGIYQTRHGENLFDAIDGDIDDQAEWKTYVYLPLLDAYDNSQEIGAKAAAAAKTAKTTTPAAKTGGTAKTNTGAQQQLATRLKQSQKSLGLPESGALDNATLQAMITKLGGQPQAQPVTSVAPAGVQPLASSQPTAGMTPEQIQAALTRINQNTNRPV